MGDAYARDRRFWLTVALSAIVGLISAGSVLAFLALEHLATTLVWGHHETPTGWFSGGFVAIGALLVGGLVVGLLRKYWHLDGVDPNFVDELIEGNVPLGHGVRLGLLGLASLVSGAAIGPEAPLGSLGASIGTGVADRAAKGDTSEDRAVLTEDLSYSGISAVFGALTSFTFTGPIMAMETRHARFTGSLRRTLPGVVSATTALAVIYPLIGSPFLDVFDLGTTKLKVAWIGWAVVYGAIGAAVGLIAAVALGVSKAASKRVGNPVARSVMGGAVIAAIGFALPLTLFSGRGELQPIIDHGTDLGIGLLLAVIVGKLIAFAISMRWGFFGGPIFPVFFIASVVAVLISGPLGDVPLAVSIPATAAGAAATLMPMPLMVIVFATMMFGLPVEMSVVPSVATVVSLVLIHGTGVLQRLANKT